jgi:hypothetical protein
VWIAAVVLAVAGAGKLFRPAAARPALRSLRLPSTDRAVRVLGAVEVLIGAAVFAVGGAGSAVALAAAYGALATAALRLRRSAGLAGGAAGCGCFGAAAAPVGWSHVVLDAAALVAAAGAALTELAPLGRIWPELPAAGVAHGVLVAAGTAAAIAAMTVLPEVRLAARPQPARDPQVHLFGPTIARKPTAPSPLDGGAARSGGGSEGRR